MINVINLALFINVHSILTNMYYRRQQCRKGVQRGNSSYIDDKRAWVSCRECCIQCMTFQKLKIRRRYQVLLVIYNNNDRPENGNSNRGNKTCTKTLLLFLLIDHCKLLLLLFIYKWSWAKKRTRIIYNYSCYNYYNYSVIIIILECILMSLTRVLHSIGMKRGTETLL